MPMLWAWTTFALVAIISEEVWQAVRLRRMKIAVKQQDVIKARIGQTPGQQRENTSGTNYHRRSRFAIVTVLVVLFSIGLGYCFHMVMRFRTIGAIDTRGWSFGQVVAALFWIPVVLDVAHSIFGKQAPCISWLF